MYKLSGNRRNPWIARKTTGWDENKKQMYYTIGYFRTRAEALSALAEYNKKPIGQRRDITLGELYDEWFDGKFVNVRADAEGKKKKGQSEGTKKTYETAWNHLSELKDMLVRDIKTSHLRGVIKKMEVEKKLGQSSCQKVKVLAGILMKSAMADDIIDTNYAEMIEISEDNRKEIEIFTDLEVQTLWQKVDEVEWVDTILIFVYTGMRISELLALTKFNIDLEDMLITGGAKTDAGRDRIIPIHKKIQPYIIKWYNTEGEHLITRNNEKINVKYYREKLYYPALEAAEVKKLTPHKARHTFATLLHKAGVDMDTRQKLLGHSDVATTMHYTHPDIAVLREAVGRL